MYSFDSALYVHCHYTPPFHNSVFNNYMLPFEQKTLSIKEFAQNYVKLSKLFPVFKLYSEILGNNCQFSAKQMYSYDIIPFRPSGNRKDETS